MAKLQEMGEFVRSASSTIEAPVVRRLKEAFADQAAAAKAALAQSADGDRAADGARRAANGHAAPASAGAIADGELAGSQSAEGPPAATARPEADQSAGVGERAAGQGDATGPDGGLPAAGVPQVPFSQPERPAASAEDGGQARPVPACLAGQAGSR